MLFDDLNRFNVDDRHRWFVLAFRLGRGDIFERSNGERGKQSQQDEKNKGQSKRQHHEREDGAYTLGTSVLKKRPEQSAKRGGAASSEAFVREGVVLMVSGGAREARLGVARSGGGKHGCAHRETKGVKGACGGGEEVK